VSPKFHLVNWKTICSSVPRGGLGVKISCCSIKLYLVNGFGDLCKRRLLFGDKVIVEKYGVLEGVGVQRKLEGPMGCAFGGILGMVGGISPTLSPSRLGMDPVFVFGMMFGAEKLLSSLHFLELYLIARDKEALVSDYLDSFGTSIPLESEFHRAVQDWELESLDSFLNLLYSLKTHLGRWIECCGPQLAIMALK
jgi:hypothetical protein